MPKPNKAQLGANLRASLEKTAHGPETLVRSRRDPNFTLKGNSFFDFEQDPTGAKARARAASEPDMTGPTIRGGGTSGYGHQTREEIMGPDNPPPSLDPIKKRRGNPENLKPKTSATVTDEKTQEELDEERAFTRGAGTIAAGSAAYQGAGRGVQRVGSAATSPRPRGKPANYKLHVLTALLLAGAIRVAKYGSKALTG